MPAFFTAWMIFAVSFWASIGYAHSDVPSPTSADQVKVWFFVLYMFLHGYMTKGWFITFPVIALVGYDLWRPTFDSLQTMA